MTIKMDGTTIYSKTFSASSSPMRRSEDDGSGNRSNNNI